MKTFIVCRIKYSSRGWRGGSLSLRGKNEFVTQLQRYNLYTHSWNIWHKFKRNGRLTLYGWRMRMARWGESYDMTADICHNPLRNTSLPDSARQMTLSSEPTPLGFNQSISPHYHFLLRVHSFPSLLSDWGSQRALFALNSEKAQKKGSKLSQYSRDKTREQKKKVYRIHNEERRYAKEKQSVIKSKWVSQCV